MSGPAIYDFDLNKKMEEAKQLPLSGGRATHAVVSFPNLKLLVVYMPEKSVWSEHSTTGRIAVQVLRGHIAMTTLGQTFDLPSGRGVSLDADVVHDVHAREESWFLLTVAR